MKLLKLNDGSWSKTKIVSVLSSLFGLATALGFLHLTPEQISGIMAGIVGLIGLFLRSGMDEPAP